MQNLPPLHVLTIELDRLMAEAIRADLPHASIRAIRPLEGDVPPAVAPRPNLVILNASATDATAQRGLIRQVWGGGVLVVELSDTEPRALIWRSAAGVEVVELRPGFLAPFLSARAVSIGAESGLLPAVRYVSYAALLSGAVMGISADQLSLVLLSLGGLMALVGSRYRQTWQGGWRSQRPMI